jgi:hypothetical protein
MESLRRSAFAIAGMVVASSLAADAAQGAAPLPDFSGYWTRDGETPSTFDPPPNGPSTIMPSVPHYGHCVVGSEPNPGGGDPPCPPGVTNRESNAWIADWTNPILQPWTREALRKNAEGEAKGISHLSFQQNCKPSGVPQVLNLRYTVQLLQTPGQVTVLYENNQWVRRVYMNETHPAGLKPTWYGHSVGHYEGDALVIDTVAQDASTEVDRFGTLHSGEMRVVERYRMVDQNHMQVIFTVEDPKAYTMAWRGVANYRRTPIKEGFAFPEYVCAENNRATHDNQIFLIPNDAQPDF